MDAYDFTALGIELTLQNEEYEERERQRKANPG